MSKNTLSSQMWISRRKKDKYVDLANDSGYRSRSVFKLINIENKFKILKNLKHKANIIDLGSSPGGWLQFIQEYSINNAKDFTIIGVDLKPIEEINGVILMQKDFLDDDFSNECYKALRMKNTEIENIPLFDAIFSDMCPNSSGDKKTDQIRLITLLDKIITFINSYLAVNGSVVIKVLSCGKEKDILLSLQKHFVNTTFFKPDSSYSTSSEIFIVAIKKIP